MLGQGLELSAVPEKEMPPLEDAEGVEEVNVPTRLFTPSGRGRGINPSAFQERRHPGRRGRPSRLSELREDAARVGAVNAEMRR